MRPLSRYFSTRQLVILGMVVPALVLLGVGGLQWQSVRDYRASREGATHTRTVLLSLESFLACVNDAETGQRGYLLTHKESYLAPYEHALATSRDQLQNLRQLTSDEAAQQKNLELLEPLVATKLAELAQTVARERNLDHAGALQIVMTDLGKDTMDRIRATLGGMHDFETGLLEQREQTYQRMARVNSELSALLIVVGLGFVVAIILLLRRMEEMEEMIKICAWSKMIEYQGEWLSIEEYLTRRFKARITHGMSQVEAEKMLQLLQAEKPRVAA